VIAAPHGLGVVEAWFAARGWTPFGYQRRAWAAAREGRSGLIHVPTGAGKTYAAYLGPLSRLIDQSAPSAQPDRIGRGARIGARSRARGSAIGAKGLRILVITPLRAVARDCEAALRLPIDDLRLPFVVGARTGDTTPRERARQRERLPEVLVTTPESLSLLLCRDAAASLFEHLDAVIVDEWHELMSSKRGVQTELALARLRHWRPACTIWGLSATLARPREAARHLLGTGEREPMVIDGGMDRPVRVDALLPESIDQLPWSGHMGLVMLEPLCRWLDPSITTLVFTNTRSQAERWFAELLRARPEWHGRVALHHGSIDPAVRRRVERGIETRELGIVVATSSLDLGVDFSPVERVVQIGSPKGVARLMQRAGRAAHRPGAECRVLCIPTHAMELLEIAAARQAIGRGEIETRAGPSIALDCLAQHLVTIATGGGFRPEELYDEVRSTQTFRDLTRSAFEWIRSLVTEGGASLRAYERFRRVRVDSDGVHRVRDARIARAHRLNVGTITSEPVLTVRLTSGRTLGTIEEDFVARLRMGERFVFAGETLEFVRLHEMTALVRRSKARTTFTPRWMGGRFPLSTAMSKSLRRLLDDAAHGRCGEPEASLASPMLEAQAELSRLPRLGETLIEYCRTDAGQHLFIYPFEGRLVHEGLAALLALRLGRIAPATFVITINDYGIELLSACEHDLAALLAARADLFSSDGVADDLAAAVRAGDLSSRQFREIARVAGLVQQREAKAERSARQVMASASLIFEVLRDFEPENLLLHQAEREVLARHFEDDRLARTLERIAAEPRVVVRLRSPGPLAWPLVAERIGVSSLSTESLQERLRSMLAERLEVSGAGRRRTATRAVARGVKSVLPSAP